MILNSINETFKVKNRRAFLTRSIFVSSPSFYDQHLMYFVIAFADNFLTINFRGIVFG